MQFKALIALIPLLATASAFFIPDEYQHDGFFTVDFDADGKPTFTEHDLAALVGRSAVEQKRDATSPSAKFAAAAKLERRDSWGSTGRLFPNHDDYNACTNEMKVWLNNGNTLPGHSKGWIRRNQAILMLCNYSGNGNQPPLIIAQRLTRAETL
jgi:hypothetical protein